MIDVNVATAARTLNDIHLADPKSVVSGLCREIRAVVRRTRTRGCVVAVSGGIDSSVCLALAATAIGADRTIGIALPDKDSSPDSLLLARKLCNAWNVKLVVSDISEPLDALGCYSRQANAVSSLYPEFSTTEHQFSVIFRQDFYNTSSLPLFRLIVQLTPDHTEEVRLTPDAYSELVAATNMKQRVRMLLTHAEAERRRLAVIGTSNRIELEQGFFVRYGDGTGDIAPLRELLKMHVYDIATYLEIEPEIINRVPTTDTYSAEQTQESFFYGLSRELNDVLWHNYCAGFDAASSALACGLPLDYVSNVYSAFTRRAELSSRLRIDPIH